MAFKYSKRVTSKGWKSQTDIVGHSKNSRKIKQFHKKDSKFDLAKNLNQQSLCHIFRADNTNCGDWWSMPAHYFSFPSHDNVLDLSDIDDEMDIHGTVIIGGGGLIGPAFSQIEKIIRRPNQITIGWGLGNNMIDEKKIGYIDKTAPLPSYTEKFTLLGIRDYDTSYRWVPCASCMHPAFSKSYKINHDIVVFEHKRIPLGIKGVPVLTNNGHDIDKILAFLGSGETIITNSYHGAYWATLLGRKCITIPFSSKFFGFKHELIRARKDEWKDKISLAKEYPQALSECRKANINFYADVMNILT